MKISEGCYVKFPECYGGEDFSGLWRVVRHVVGDAYVVENSETSRICTLNTVNLCAFRELVVDPKILSNLLSRSL